MLTIEKNFSNKCSEDAANFESVYNMIIQNESAATKAHELIMKAIQKTPTEDKSDLAVRYMKRAWSHLLMEDFENAFLDAKRSQSFEVPNTVIWNSFEILGYCYARKKDYKNSEKQFLSALEHLRNSGVSNELKATVTGRIMTVFKTVKTAKGKKQKETMNESKSSYPMLPNISYGHHKLYECMTSAVDVVMTEERGRCVIANRSIKPGNLLLLLSCLLFYCLLRLII